jgi:hypothetical protein
MMEQKYARIIEMGAHPNRSVQCCGQTVVGGYRRDKALLECERGGQP